MLWHVLPIRDTTIRRCIGDVDCGNLLLGQWDNRLAQPIHQCRPACAIERDSAGKDGCGTLKRRAAVMA